MMQSLYVSHDSVMIFARHHMDPGTSLSQGSRETSPLQARLEGDRDNVLPFEVIGTRAEERMDTHVLYSYR